MHYPLGTKNPTKPHPSLPQGRLTPASEYAQVGWISARLPRVVDGPRFMPGGERCGDGPVKADLAGGFDQQDRTGLRDHGSAVVPDTDMGVRPGRLLHLKSASDRGGNKDLSNPHSRCSEALFAYLTACRTAAS
ncbi:hypothetical protein GCM10010254_03160 [Streptomyces chromofuscus]|nr:hypothetical protein GCM10010254_03160 [Streptomyces chromofuscus]